jgi:hypothetical protein
MCVGRGQVSLFAKSKKYRGNIVRSATRVSRMSQHTCTRFRLFELHTAREPSVADPGLHYTSCKIICYHQCPYMCEIPAWHTVAHPTYICINYSTFYPIYQYILLRVLGFPCSVCCQYTRCLQKEANIFIECVVILWSRSSSKQRTT